MSEVFLEQPLALPGSAKQVLVYVWRGVKSVVKYCKVQSRQPISPGDRSAGEGQGRS